MGPSHPPPKPASGPYSPVSVTVSPLLSMGQLGLSHLHWAPEPTRQLQDTVSHTCLFCSLFCFIARQPPSPASRGRHTGLPRPGLFTSGRAALTSHLCSHVWIPSLVLVRSPWHSVFQLRLHYLPPPASLNLTPATFISTSGLQRGFWSGQSPFFLGTAFCRDRQLLCFYGTSSRERSQIERTGAQGTWHRPTPSHISAKKPVGKLPET